MSVNALVSLMTLLLLISANGSLANSTIQPANIGIYKLGSQPCQDCHDANKESEEIKSNPEISLTALKCNSRKNYAIHLSQKLQAHGLFFCGQLTGHPDRVTLADDAILRTQEEFVPSVKIREFTVDGAVNEVSAEIDPGFDYNGKSSSIKPNVEQASVAGVIPVVSTNGARFDFRDVPLKVRGDRRRNNDPFVFKLNLINDAGFTATTVDNKKLNEVSIQFRNIPPESRQSVDAFSVSAGQTVSGNVLAVGGDGDPDSDEITAVLEPELEPIEGTLQFRSNGAFEFTPPSPPPAFNERTFRFRYRIVDGEGARSEPVQVRITELPLADGNQEPQALDDLFTTDEDTPLVGNVIDGSGGGKDTDDGILKPLAATLLVEPSFGTVVLRRSGRFRYRPDRDTTGDADNRDRFVYQVSDGVAVAQATVTIDIVPKNDPPKARRMEKSLLESDTVQRYDLLDPLFVSDADGDRLSVVEKSLAIEVKPKRLEAGLKFPLNGKRLRFDPKQFAALEDGEIAVVVVRYRVRDPAGATDEGVLRVTVEGVDDGIGRVVGQYADTLSERYQGHFLPRTQEPAACLACHQKAHVGAQFEGICPKEKLTAFGFRLCQLRDDTLADPLSDLRRRMRQVEPLFAPRMDRVPTIRIRRAKAKKGAPVGEPLTASYTGLTVGGRPARIFGWGFVGKDGRLRAEDEEGLFEISAAGQITVKKAPLKAKRYVRDVRPINDARQRDNDGNVVARPGFFPIVKRLLRQVVIVVEDPASPVAVADAVNAAAGESVTVPVLANDTGGRATRVGIERAPARGRAAAQGTAIVYTGDAGFAGIDRLAYRSENEAGASEAAAVTIRVVPPGGAVARDDAAATAVDRPVTVDVLANDSGADLTARIVARPASGRAAVTRAGRIAFTPAPGFVGEVAIGYAARNAVAASEAVLTVRVVPGDAELLASATEDPELRKVARALGRSCERLRRSAAAGAEARDLQAICGDLAADALRGEGIDPALAAIRNEEALAAFTQIESFGRDAGAALRRRIDRLRSGDRGRGLDASGLGIRFGDEALPADGLDTIGRAFLGPPGAGSAWGGFVSGDIVFGSTDASGSTEGSELTGASVSLGADYRLSPSAVAGLALSYARAETDFDGGGRLEGTSFQVSGYGVYDGFAARGLSLAGIATYGFDSFDQTRPIGFAAGGREVDRDAVADYSARHLNLIAELNYAIAFGVGGSAPPGTLDLFVGADYLVGWIDAYTETGAGGLSLRVEDQRHESLVLTAGLEVSRPVPVGAGLVQPSATLAANAELLDDWRSLTSRFAVDPGAPGFTVVEAGDEGIFGSVELGTLILMPRWELDLRLASDFGRETMNGYRLSAGLASPLSSHEDLGVGLATSGAGGLDAVEARIDYRLRF